MARPFKFDDLLVGFSINQLAQLFDLDRRTVSDRLRAIEPSGSRSQHPVYKIKDAAPLLCEGYAKAGSLDKLAATKGAAAEKDYWDARLKEQKFRENNGDLWRTTKIVEVFSSVFRKIRESVVVFVDMLEHEADLPPKQVVKVKNFGDALLTELRDKLLQLDTGSDDHPGMTLDDQSADEQLANDLSDLGLD